MNLFLSAQPYEQSYTNNYVQTRAQQAGDQPPVVTSSVALRGVTAEGDAATTTTFSGRALKSAVPGLWAQHKCPKGCAH